MKIRNWSHFCQNKPHSPLCLPDTNATHTWYSSQLWGRLWEKHCNQIPARFLKGNLASLLNTNDPIWARINNWIPTGKSLTHASASECLLPALPTRGSSCPCSLHHDELPCTTRTLAPCPTLLDVVPRFFLHLAAPCKGFTRSGEFSPLPACQSSSTAGLPASSAEASCLHLATNHFLSPVESGCQGKQLAQRN